MSKRVQAASRPNLCRNGFTQSDIKPRSGEIFLPNSPLSTKILRLRHISKSDWIILLFKSHQVDYSRFFIGIGVDREKLTLIHRSETFKHFRYHDDFGCGKLPEITCET